MKFQVMEPKQKLPDTMTEGDFIAYRNYDGEELIVGMLVLIKSGEYRFVNMDTGMAGNIFRPALRALVEQYAESLDFKYYSRKKYTLNMVLEETR